MIVVISPAKSMLLDEAARKAAATTPRFAAAADALATKLAALPAPKLSALLGVSAALGKLNADRYGAWADSDDRWAAGVVMDGPAYKALALRTALGNDKLMRSVDKRVRILSGLYGVLRPGDGIQAHRLEMGTKLDARLLPGAPAPTLYAHWGDKIAKALESETDCIVNAASAEYWKSVAGHFSKSTRIVTVSFPGPAVYAKAARGAIARFAAENEIDDPSGLKEFTGLAGEWSYDAAASSKDELVFRRGAGVKKEPAAKRAKK